ncbi:MAG: DNA mismatch repair protein MutS, partial [Sphingomonadales bacterium]|nr:DNA mismatch repair protein MutS [Sphingomonadales bacterium]
MRHQGRRLSSEEAALWARVASTIHPLKRGAAPAGIETPRVAALKPALNPAPAAPGARAAAVALDRRTLDAGWDRRLARGAIAPDVTLDLHGASLATAHA